MIRTPEPSVTISEAVTVLRRLEPRVAGEVTERQVRYAAAMFGLTGGRRGATVLLSRVDLLLIRLLLRLEGSGISRPLARFAAVAIAPEVRAVCERGRPIAAVVVVPVVATYPKVRRPVLTTEGEARRLRLGGVFVSLRTLLAGVLEAMRDIRVQEPQVWQWKPVNQADASTTVTQIHARPETARTLVSV